LCTIQASSDARLKRQSLPSLKPGKLPDFARYAAIGLLLPLRGDLHSWRSARDLRVQFLNEQPERGVSVHASAIQPKAVMD
jgi:hypothetical protein